MHWGALNLQGMRMPIAYRYYVVSKYHSSVGGSI